MTIFLLLNGLGLAFLLYVLANFWNVGRQAIGSSRKHAAEFGRRDGSDAIVAMHPISRRAPGSLSVIPFQAQDRKSGGKADRGQTAREAIEIPLRRMPQGKRSRS